VKKNLLQNLSSKKDNYEWAGNVVLQKTLCLLSFIKNPVKGLFFFCLRGNLIEEICYHPASTGYKERARRRHDHSF